MKKEILPIFIIGLDEMISFQEKLENYISQPLGIKFDDLTDHQKDLLKNEFETNPKLGRYKLVMVCFDFETAARFFLEDDIKILADNIF